MFAPLALPLRLQKKQKQLCLRRIVLSMAANANAICEAADEGKLRDPKDRPILRAALNAHADLFLTGDKDFLESAITDPRIISVAQFLDR